MYLDYIHVFFISIKPISISTLRIVKKLAYAKHIVSLIFHTKREMIIVFSKLTEEKSDS